MSKRAPTADDFRMGAKISGSPWEHIDWQQIILNGGPPCFHLESDGRFCLRAERWLGHGRPGFHGFVSIAQAVSERGGA